MFFKNPIICYLPIEREKNNLSLPQTFQRRKKLLSRSIEFAQLYHHGVTERYNFRKNF